MGAKAKPAEKLVIAPTAFEGTRKDIEHLAKRHQDAIGLLKRLSAGDKRLSRHTLELAASLTDAANACSRLSRSIILWCDLLDNIAYFPSDASYREAMSYGVHRLKAAALYMASPVPDTISMSAPGPMAIDALEAIERFANR